MTTTLKVAIVGHEYRLWAPLTPDTIYEPGRMVGGGETAMIRVSQELAQRGHNVTVYAHTPQDATYGGVEWRRLKPDGDFRSPPEPVDVALSYDYAASLRHVPAQLKVLENQTNNPVVAEGSPIDAFVFKSNWHASHVTRTTPTINPELCHVIGNGVDMWLYDEQDRIPKVPGRMIWTSSPDRGLHHCLEVFRRVRAKIPHATLHVYYDMSKAFEGSKWAMDYRSETLWRAKRGLETTEGATYVGPVDKRTLAQAQMEAEVLLFPEETPQPSEGFGISLIESMSAGCVPLISDNDALPELWGSTAPMLPLPIDYEQWTEAAVDLLSSPDMREQYREAGWAKATEYTWGRIGEQYEALLLRLYHDKPCPCCGRKLEIVHA